MTAQEMAEIAEMRGELRGMDKRLERVEHRLDGVATKSDISELRSSLDRERESMVELRIEDIQRREHDLKEQLKATSRMRRSLSPGSRKGKTTLHTMLPWLLGVLGTLGAALATYLAT